MSDPLEHWLVESEDGWTVDVTGEADPRWRAPWLSLGILLVGILLALNTTVWVLAPFMAMALGVIQVWQGEALYGFEWSATTLAPIGLAPIPLGSIRSVEAEGRTLRLRMEPLDRDLQLDAAANAVLALAHRIQADLDAHRRSMDVAEPVNPDEEM